MINNRGILTVCLLVALFIMAMTRSYGHNADMGWNYDPYCCNGNQEHGDCQEIDSKTVKPVEGGFLVTLNPGDHRLVTKPHTYMVPNDQIKHSPDGRYHACLYPTENDMRCFYVPPMGM